MKYFLLLCFGISSLTIFLPAENVRAGDCFQDPVYERNWNAEVTTGARVRDVACMEGSVVIATLPVGEVVTVIAETDGWYKIRRSNGTEGWVGQWLVSPTNKSASDTTTPPPTTNEPLWDITGHDYETAIRYLHDAGIISGYSDGSYKPDHTINRAEFTKIILGAVVTQEEITGEQCFPDVNREWFAKYVCMARQRGIIQGYPDGSFQPGNSINFVESASIIVKAFGMQTTPADPWYRGYVEQLANLNGIPMTILQFDQRISRGEMAEIIYRLKLQVQDKPSSTYADLLP